jgi:hypothetical protein
VDIAELTEEAAVADNVELAGKPESTVGVELVDTVDTTLEEA